MENQVRGWLTRLLLGSLYLNSRLGHSSFKGEDFSSHLPRLFFIPRFPFIPLEKKIGKQEPKF
jgi:hypothetical protein